MPIEIDPNTGAPIIKSDAPTDFTVPTTEPTVTEPVPTELVSTEESLHSSVDTPTTGEGSSEGTDGTDSTDGESQAEEVIAPSDNTVKMDAEQESQVREVLRYSCSDSQAADKAFQAIDLILQKKRPKE